MAMDLVGRVDTVAVVGTAAVVVVLLLLMSCFC